MPVGHSGVTETKSSKQACDAVWKKSAEQMGSCRDFRREACFCGLLQRQFSCGTISPPGEQLVSITCHADNGCGQAIVLVGQRSSLAPRIIFTNHDELCVFSNSHSICRQRASLRRWHCARHRRSQRGEAAQTSSETLGFQYDPRLATKADFSKHVWQLIQVAESGRTPYRPVVG